MDIFAPKCSKCKLEPTPLNCSLQTLYDTRKYVCQYQTMLLDDNGVAFFNDPSDYCQSLQFGTVQDQREAEKRRDSFRYINYCSVSYPCPIKPKI